MAAFGRKQTVNKSDFYLFERPLSGGRGQDYI